MKKASFIIRATVAGGLTGGSIGFCANLVASPLGNGLWGVFEWVGRNEMVFGPGLAILVFLVEGVFVGGIFGALGGVFAKQSLPPLVFGFGALLITLCVAVIADTAVAALFVYVDLAGIAFIAAAAGGAIGKRIDASH